MNHLNQDDLVLYYYREGGALAEAHAHIEECAECRAELATLRKVLDAFDGLSTPERDPGYGAEVWRRIQPQSVRPKKVIEMWRVIGAIAAMVVFAFLAGRYMQKPTPGGPASVAASGQVRERILLVALGDHLERSQMVLIELANASPGRTRDITGEQERAEDLISENRLYRQTALTAGETNVATVLDELERLLLEIAHSPSKISSPELTRLKERIEADGLLFKVRVVESNLREREKHDTL